MPRPAPPHPRPGGPARAGAAHASAAALVEAARRLSHAVDDLRFAAPVTHVLNPLDYAWEMHRRYLERYGDGSRRVVFVGMNPGPFGMAQTGVPFGEVAAVRDWLGLDAPIGRPAREHPERPVDGLACARSEVSGARLWGFARSDYGTPERFFARFFVWNYCPLAFMESSGKNRTPDKLAKAEAHALYEACDEALRALVGAVSPKLVIGVGAFAEARAREALDGLGVPIGRIAHPSPASPAANRDWAGTVRRELAALGLAV